jgi:hypothetical protein
MKPYFSGLEAIKEAISRADHDSRTNTPRANSPTTISPGRSRSRTRRATNTGPTGGPTAGVSLSLSCSLAEQLQIIDDLPEEERFEAAYEIIHSHVQPWRLQQEQEQEQKNQLQHQNEPPTDHHVQHSNTPPFAFYM